MNIWLDGVIDAMDKDELVDPMNNFWSLHSRPEDRVVDPTDRPADEWDYVKKENNLRRRGGMERREPWGDVSER